MNRALVIIDMQNDYFPGGKMELVGIQAAAAKVGRLLANFVPKGSRSFTFSICRPDLERPSSCRIRRGWKFMPRLHRWNGEPVIRKQFPNSFRETSLLSELQNRDIKELVICGAMSHMCIDTTVRAGFDLGLSWIVVADACATRDLSYGNQVITAARYMEPLWLRWRQDCDGR